MFSALRRILDYRVISTKFGVCQQGDQDTLACLGVVWVCQARGWHRSSGSNATLSSVPARYQMLLGK